MGLHVLKQTVFVLLCVVFFIAADAECVFLAADVYEHGITRTDTGTNSRKNEIATVETYHYDMRPAGSKSKKRKRDIELKYLHTGAGSFLMMNTQSSKNLESIDIFFDTGGRFVSGSKTVNRRKSGKLKSHGMAWREGQVLKTKRIAWSGWSMKEYELDEEKSLAMDASLLFLLRFFPFDQNKEWKIYMVDFSQKSITVTARQTGVETVRVIAGEFRCYKIEVTVNLIIFTPRITYWLSRAKPHFLVKHRGMIEPLSRTYITQLVSIGDKKKFTAEGAESAEK